MELFDTHFVWLGQVLSVSGMKLLVTSNRYVQVVKSQPHLDSFWTTHIYQNEINHHIMNVHIK